MSVYLVDNNLVIDLTPTEAKMARKILPVVAPFLENITKDALRTCVNWAATARVAVEEYKKTGRFNLPELEWVGSSNISEAIERDMPNAEELMKILELELPRRGEGTSQ